MSNILFITLKSPSYNELKNLVNRLLTLYIYLLTLFILVRRWVEPRYYNIQSFWIFMRNNGLLPDIPHNVVD